MYRELLEKFNVEVMPEEEPVKKGGKGLITPRNKPVEDKSDPLALMKQWMQVIKTSGANARKKAEALEEEQQVAVRPEPTTEQPKEESKPDEEPKEIKETKMASLFSGLDIGDDSPFVLPIYKGDNNQWVSLARQAASKHNIPEDLFLRLVQQESGFNPSAHSKAGAIGLGQLMPATADYLGVNPLNPEQNLDGSARYLKEQYDTFGNWKHALAAYNAGPGAVSKYRGIPPYEETQNYVRSILN